MTIIDNLKKITVPLTLSTSGAIGTAANTVDIASSFNITATVTNLIFSLPAPTSTLAGDIVEICNVGTNPFQIVINGAQTDVNVNQMSILKWHGTFWVSHGSIGSPFVIPNTTQYKNIEAGNAARSGNTIFGSSTLTPGATIDDFGTLLVRASTIANAASTLNITSAQVDANSTIKIVQTSVDAVITIASPVSSTVTGRFLRLHNDSPSTKTIIYLGTYIQPGTFLDLQWNSSAWARETVSVSGNIIAKTPYNALPETVVAFDGMEIKWHNSSATSYDGIALRVVSGARSLRYTSVEHYLGNAAADAGKSVWGSNNAWYNIPNTGATATIINAVYPYAQNVTTTFLGMGNPAMPNADFRQYILYDDTNQIEYIITVDKQGSTGEVLAAQTGTCIIVVEKMGLTTNTIISAGTGITLNNGVISATAGSTRRAIVRASSASATATAGPGAVITFATEEKDTTNSFNPVTGTFVAPRTGDYKVSAQFFTASSTVAAGGRFGVILSTNGGAFGAGSPIFSYYVPVLNPSNVAFGGSYVKTLNAGDSLTFRAFLDTAAAMTLSANANFDYITIEEINNFY